MKKTYWFFLILLALTGLIVFLRYYYGPKLYGVLNPAPGVDSEIVKQIISENGALKSEISKLRLAQTNLPSQSPNYIKAFVYSRYPMNFKNELLISAGSRDGVVVGAAVIFGGELVGKVERVFDDMSLVETIFDGRYKLSVRIGNSGTQALLQGGSAPVAALIPQNASVSQGDPVYSASPDLPYGLAIGAVAEITTSSDRLFKEASLKFGYDVNSISSVLVQKSK